MNSHLPSPIRYLARLRFWSKGVLLFALAFSTAGAAIDFTPIPGERNQEGIVFKQLIFRENDRKITYEQPGGWNFTGDSKALRLTPANVAQSQADIEQSPLRAPQPMDEAALREQALKSLPQGSQQITVAAEEQNPLRINRHDTYGVTITYVLRGEEYTTNILFANLEDTQLRFRFVARKRDFEPLFRAFRGSLFTLQWAEPAKALP
jgi:hypothetical protein